MTQKRGSANDVGCLRENPWISESRSTLYLLPQTAFGRTLKRLGCPCEATFLPARLW